MSSIYLSALIFGGSLILFSLIFGGESDKNIEMDVDADVDAELDMEAEGGLPLAMHGEVDSTWLPFLSMRFWTFGLSGFGLTGGLLELLGTAFAVHLSLAILLGVGVGWATAFAFQKLKTSSVTSITHTETLHSAEAIALLPIEPGKMGKVRVKKGGEIVDLIAQSNESIQRGETILIVHIENGIADVCSLKANRKKQHQPIGEKHL